MSRILITGGSSYLGQHLVPIALANGHTVGYTYHQNKPALLPHQFGQRVDIRQQTAVSHYVTQFQPDIIIHTAGSNRGTDITAVIEQGATHIASAARQVRARLIHLSTDVIFDGTAAPYSETAVATPLHVYGRAKANAEAIVARYPDHVIVRTSLIYGRRIMDRSTEWIVTALQAQKPVTLFTNQFRSPVWVETLCQSCLELGGNTYQGVLNVAGRQRVSRAELGLKLLDWWEIEERTTLTTGPAPMGQWPPDCTLDVSRATAVLVTPLPGVDDVLQR